MGDKTKGLREVGDKRPLKGVLSPRAFAPGKGQTLLTKGVWGVSLQGDRRDRRGVALGICHWRTGTMSHKSIRTEVPNDRR